jgi:electron transfer flavoprotein beta subunit
MKVVACVKQTPSTTAVFSVENGNVNWEDPGGKPNVVNPWDEYAVEEAIQLQEKHGGDAIALTMGVEESKEALKTCLAMGCTEAILLADETFAGSDTLGTARILAAAIEKIGDVQIAFCGKQAIDGDTGVTPVQLAVKLGWTPLTFVSAISELDLGEGSITVERLLPGGKQTLTARLPVVISVVKEINDPRYPSFMGIRKANRATIPTWTAADLALDGSKAGASASNVDWSEVSELPARETAAEIVEGETTEEKVKTLVDRLFEEKVI